MATYLKGDFKKNEVFVNTTFGGGIADMMLHVGGIFNGRKIVLAKELLGTKLLTEETAKTFLRTAGWGLLGGALLGPAGLLAGVLTKGTKKSNFVACELKTGEKFVMELSDKEYGKILDKVYAKNGIFL